ncbi:hypothetical protein KCG44_13555 [Pacificimonas sp. WHA3]|uniref:Type II secretion system protein GspC N-terminal domain-containing protein n=1 Tax=Pacificimonas pallii TaxID=2827236 RepID=A0ABS6SIW0_9SPHN|nr:hypothetical protein [Pacificimonas pallii]MBV7257807.1 hypothetical protein [Pacificimonas pallii]
MAIEYLTRLSRRERLMLLFGAAIIVILALVFVFSSTDKTQETDRAPILVAPQPQMARPAISRAQPAPPATATWPAGITLTGVSARHGGGAAFLEMADGKQRRVPVGRTMISGWTLTEVGPRYAIFGTASGATRRLTLTAAGLESADVNGAKSTDAPSASADIGATAQTATAARDTAFTAMSLSMEEAEEAGYRGYRLTAAPPVLSALGLRAGDLLVEFDDNPFDDSERVQELAGDVVAGRGGTLTYVRAGAERTVEIPQR